MITMLIFTLATLPPLPSEESTGTTAEQDPAPRQGDSEEPFDYAGFTITVEELDLDPVEAAEERVMGGTVFVVLRLKVENSSLEPLEVEREWFQLVDGEEARHAYDLGIAGGLSVDVNPGTDVVLENTYKVPVDAEITHLWVDDEYVEDSPIRVDF
ncbi:hypothetical protein A6A08_21920 [Nocardiopsis sp. TSRI0078]|uniref:DUF4352 domain-containing protein n=1 Tax=unclassified Nocardiopsis TaxID=2649073 RepID=UPI000939B971|nr:hypothetical protein [Nocardiopsis sp. TSRI0078]OKI21033.1 hypothetical protein A6A08_21920 [Nocardiopsis sp. TSRI0078]